MKEFVASHFSKHHKIILKTFIDELFAATEVEKIRAAVHSIFSHLKKIRSCQEYPVQRALS